MRMNTTITELRFLHCSLLALGVLGLSYVQNWRAGPGFGARLQESGPLDTLLKYSQCWLSFGVCFAVFLGNDYTMNYTKMTR
jgi:hypothetical protein